MHKIVILLSALVFSGTALTGDFTIATQNLWHYNNDYEIRESNLIASVQDFAPDIVAFQEAAKWMSGEGLFDVFVEQTGYVSRFSETNNVFVMYEGVAIASKFPAGSATLIELPFSSTFGFRPMQILPVRTPDGEITILNVHLSPFADGRAGREAQIEFIAVYIEKKLVNKKIILLGDFNQEDEGGLFDRLKKIGFSDVPVKDACTYCHGDNPYAEGNYRSHLDHLFFRSTDFVLKAQGRLFEKRPVSDHYGVWAELSFR